MGDWLLRATKQHITSRSPRSMEVQFGGSFVNGAGKAVSNAIAIFTPDLSAVAGFESKYWTISGNVVSLMEQADRDTVDADAEDARKDALEAEFAADPAAETTRQLINEERVARGVSELTPAQYRANFRANL